MDSDIELGRNVVRGVVGGIEDAAHSLIDADSLLTPAERAVRHAVAKGVRELLNSLTDSVAEAVQADREG